MRNTRSLEEHYDQKYRQSDYTQVNPVSIIYHPRNRFEMAVKIAISGKGRYLEIGAGCGFSRVVPFGYGSWASVRSPSLLCRILPSLFSEVFIIVYK